MALEIQRRVGDRLADGIAVVPRDSALTAERDSILKKKIRVVASSHPVPDESSERAALLACEMLHGAAADDLVIVAISGGASAMFTRPAEGLTLADKIAVNEALLKAGASIRELNTVRKHLSAVKGGRLLRHCGGARVLGLILSDVPGNDLATIGSGLTAGDWSSFGDAVSVMKRRSVWGRAPEAVRSFLERAVAGEMGATVKIGDPILERVTNVIIGDNSSGSGSSRARRGGTWVSSSAREGIAWRGQRCWPRARAGIMRGHRRARVRGGGRRACGDGARRRQGRARATMCAGDGNRAVAESGADAESRRWSRAPMESTGRPTPRAPLRRRTRSRTESARTSAPRPR